MNPDSASTRVAWHARTTDDVLEQLRAKPNGLSTAAAAMRLATQGPNTLREFARIGAVRRFARQFKSIVIWLLIAAALIAGTLGETFDAVAIIAIVILNAIIGFGQEWSAEKSIMALRRITAPAASALRDGFVTTVPADQIVVGDILVLMAGDLVAADARVLSAASLTCVESALTGESTSVRKSTDVLTDAAVPLGDRANMVFMGTAIATGVGHAVVVHTGMDTELGRIATMIGDADTDDTTPLQRNLDAFGNTLVWSALAIIILLFGIGLWRGTPLLDVFLTAVSLAVAAVPEGLPAMVTVALSLGVLRMARHGALVRKMAAVETLGATNVICTDKTGTLTVGEMTVRALFVSGHQFDVSGEGYGTIGEVRVSGDAPTDSTTTGHKAALATLSTIFLGRNSATLENDAGTWRAIGDPTEAALLVAGIKAGGNRKAIDEAMPRVQEFPFDSDRKRSSAVRRVVATGMHRALVLGAPSELLESSSHIDMGDGVRLLTADDRARIRAQTSTMAQHALRVIAAAYRDLGPAIPDALTADAVERDLTFVGLAGMYDPPRPEVRDAIRGCYGAGVRVVMITGDHPETAVAVAAELGISANDAAAVSGRDLDAMTDEELRARVSEIAVYARVSAEHKLRIIRAWKSHNAIVAMTGDGVNDAPAVKGADIGIAMGRAGTEVTRQAADLIITDDNFATIVTAIREGRGIYDNIRKTLQYLLAGNTGELLLMAVCVVVGLPAPLLPIHLLWINLVTDGLPALALAVDPIDNDVMTQPPRPRDQRITDQGFLRMTLLTGCITATLAFAVFVVMLRTEPVETARSWAFSVLVFEELFRAFGARSKTRAVWHTPLRTNLPLVAVVVITVGLQLWSQHNVTLGQFLKISGMSAADGAVMCALGLIPLALLEILKAVRRRRQGSIV